MELKVFKDTLAAYAGRWETRQELPVETEILIPDYQPAIFKIVKCLIRPVILQNAAVSGRWSVQGYLRCTVFYQSDEPGCRLWRIEQKFPFEKSAELPADQQAEGPAAIWGETEYCNCRAVSEHRIDLRGAYSLGASLPVFREVELLTALENCGMEQRSLLLQTLRRAAAEEKTLTSETALLLQPGETVLDVDGRLANAAASAAAGQVNVQGTLQLQLCCQPAESEELVTHQKELTVQQSLDLPAARENDRCLVWGEILACTAEAADSGEVNLAITWKLHAELWRQEELSAVADAYSTLCKTRTVTAECRLLTPAAELAEHIPVTITDALPQQDLEVRGCFVTLGAAVPVPCPDASAPVFAIAGKGTAHVLCADARGELTCYDKAFAWQCGDQRAGRAEDVCLCLHADVTRISSAKNGAELRVDLELEAAGTLLLTRDAAALSEVEPGEELAAEDAALYLYYAQEGERIFDIAKRYHARAGDLAAANALEAADTPPQELTAPQTCLLIPAAL